MYDPPDKDPPTLIISPSSVTILYFAYAFLNGFTLSVIFVAYQLTSIVYAFFGTAALFGVLAFIGKNTTKVVCLAKGMSFPQRLTEFLQSYKKSTI